MAMSELRDQWQLYHRDRCCLFYVSIGMSKQLPAVSSELLKVVPPLVMQFLRPPLPPVILAMQGPEHSDEMFDKSDQLQVCYGCPKHDDTLDDMVKESRCCTIPGIAESVISDNGNEDYSQNTRITFSPNGEAFVVAPYGDQSLVLFDAIEGVEKMRCTCRSSSNICLTFAPSSKMVAALTGLGQGRITLYSIPNLQEVKSVGLDNLNGGSYCCLCFSPNNTFLAVGICPRTFSWDSPVIRFFPADTIDGPHPADLTVVKGRTPVEQFCARLIAIAYEPSGCKLATTVGCEQLKIFDVKSLSLLSQIQLPKIYAFLRLSHLAYFPDGEHIIVGHDACVWWVKTDPLEVLRRFDAPEYYLRGNMPGMRLYFPCKIVAIFAPAAYSKPANPCKYEDSEESIPVIQDVEHAELPALREESLLQTWADHAWSDQVVDSIVSMPAQSAMDTAGDENNNKDDDDATELQGDRVYLLAYDRYPDEFLQALISGLPLRSVREALTNAGRQCILPSGAKVFIKPYQWEDVMLQLNEHDLRPFHVVVTECFEHLVAESLQSIKCKVQGRKKRPKIRARTQLRIGGSFQSTNQTDEASEKKEEEHEEDEEDPMEHILGEIFKAGSLEVCRTFLCETSPMRSPNSVTQSTAEHYQDAHNGPRNPRRYH